MWIQVRKLHQPDTGKWCIEVYIGWRNFKLTGFWFGKRIDAPTENMENGEHILQQTNGGAKPKS